MGGKTDYEIIGPAGGRWAFIGKNGKVRIHLPANLENVEAFAEERAVIHAHGQCGYIDPTGAFVVPFKFSGCGNFSEGLADVYRDGKEQYINRNGSVALNVPFSGIHPFKNGLAAVEEGTSGPKQKFGYIDKHGNPVWKLRPSL